MSKNGNKNSSSNKGGNSNKGSKSGKGNNNRSRGFGGYDPSDFDDDINGNGTHWHTADDL